MLFFVPWAILIVVVIVAVPVAVKMSPSPVYAGGENEAGEMDEYADGSDGDQAVMVDDFGTDPNGFGGEPVGEDAFAEFK